MNELVLPKLIKLGAIVEGTHVVLKSGKHSQTYVKKDAIFTQPTTLFYFCQLMAEAISDLQVDVVVGPAIGGAILAQGVGYHLTCPRRHPLCAFAEKEGKEFVFNRGYHHVVAHKRVLVVEDVVTTGGSIQGVVKATADVGGTVIGVVALVNRGRVTASSLKVPYFTSLVDLMLETWDPDTCPMCEEDVPVNLELGHGREFMEGKKARALMTLQMG